MTDLLFDTPWWLPLLVAGVGVILFVTGNKRVENKVRYTGLAVIGLAGVLVAVSYLVDTPTETAERKTNEFVKAFNAQDWQAFGSVLESDTVVSLHSLPLYTGRDDIVEAGKNAYTRYGFKSTNALMSSAERADTVITVTITILTQEGTMGRTFNSDWAFEWQQSADGWTLVEIRCLQIGRETGESMRRMFPAGKR